MQINAIPAILQFFAKDQTVINIDINARTRKTGGATNAIKPRVPTPP